LILVLKAIRYTASLNVLGGLPISRERTPYLPQHKVNSTERADVFELQRYYMATIRVPSGHSSTGASI
jgi:hypothetical protein